MAADRLVIDSHVTCDPPSPRFVEPGEAWRCGECGQWWYRSSVFGPWPEDVKVTRFGTPRLWRKIHKLAAVDGEQG